MQGTGTVYISVFLATAYTSATTLPVQLSFEDPSSSSPSVILMNIVLDTLGIPSEIGDTSTGEIKGKRCLKVKEEAPQSSSPKWFWQQKLKKARTLGCLLLYQLDSIPKGNGSTMHSDLPNSSSNHKTEKVCLCDGTH